MSDKMVLVKESVLDSLINKALPQEYEVLLQNQPLSTDELKYYELILLLLATNIDEVINWVNSDEAYNILNGSRDLELDFWDKIEGKINNNLNTRFAEISVLLLGFYQESNRVAYSSLNLPQVFTQQDWLAFDIIKQHNYNVLSDLVKDLNKNLRDTLWKGIKEGLSTQEIADNLVKSGLEPVGKFKPQTRAEMIASTEKSRIVNTSRLQCFVDNSIREVTIIPINDGKECGLCLDLIARCPFTIEEAQGLLPLHPRCRHFWSPVIPDGKNWEDYGTDEHYVVDLTDY